MNNAYRYGDTDDDSFIRRGKPVISMFCRLGFKRKTLATVYGIKERCLDEDNSIPEDVCDALRPLMQLVQPLVAMFRGDADRMAEWLNSGNPAFSGFTPIEMVYMRRENEVVQLIKRHLSRNNQKELFLV